MQGECLQGNWPTGFVELPYTRINIKWNPANAMVEMVKTGGGLMLTSCCRFLVRNSF
jgi:hypothetical protein